MHTAVALLALWTLQGVSVPRLLGGPIVELGPGGAQPGTLSVLWLAKVGAGPYRLTYRQGGSWTEGGSTQTSGVVPVVSPAHRVEWAALTGLKPGWPVEYRVSRLGWWESGRVVAPKAPGQPFRMVVFGDCGAGTPAQAAVARQASVAKPDLVVLTGDIVYDSGTAGEYMTRFFPYYTASSGRSRLLTDALAVGVIGNHDALSFDLDRHPDGLGYYLYWRQPGNGLLSTPYPKITGTPQHRTEFGKVSLASYPTGGNFGFDYGDAHVTCLDANPYTDLGSPALHRWLRADLDRASPGAWRIVVLHESPFHSSLKHAEEKQARLLAGLFEDCHVDLVLGGHVHNYQRTRPIQTGAKLNAGPSSLFRDDWTFDREFDGNARTKAHGVVYVVEGAGGGPLYDPGLERSPGAWKPWTAAFKGSHSLGVVDVSAGKIEFRQVDTSGNEIDRWVLTKAG